MTLLKQSEEAAGRALMAPPALLRPTSGLVTVSSAAFLILTVWLTFHRVTGFEFVTLDDPLNVYHNPSFENVHAINFARFWTAPYFQLFVPLSYQLFGLLCIVAQRTPGAAFPLSPRPFHVASLILHSLNVLLVCFLLSRLTRKVAPSVLGSLVFAVHPLQVESVAWISELRGLLSAFFLLAALHMYVSFADFKQASRPLAYRICYALSVALTVCAMLSKPSAVVIGLIIAVFGLFIGRRTLREASLDAAPYLLLGLAMVAVTSHVQEAPASQACAVWLRPFIAGDALCFYLRKAVFPVNLTVDYGRRPLWVLHHWWAYVEWLVPAGLCLAAYAVRKTKPYIPFGASIAVIFLLPVLGLTPFAFQYVSTTSDRYAYLPLFGCAIVVAYAVSEVAAQSKMAVTVAIAACLTLFALMSYRQSFVWKDSFSLGMNALRANAQSAVARETIGSGYLLSKQYAEALPYLSDAAHIDPTCDAYWQGLGQVYEHVRDYPDSEKCFRTELALDPRCEPALSDLGSILIFENRATEGTACLIRALNLDPTDVEAAVELGSYYAKQGDFATAQNVFQAAIRFNPNSSVLWRYLGIALCANNRPQQAVMPLRKAVQLDPSDREARSALASLGAM